MLALLVYILIGFFTGLIARKHMPIRIDDGAFTQPFVGVLGAVFLGLATVLLFGYGRAYDYWYGYTYVAETDTNHGSGLPAYWMSYISAIVGALGSLALYRLVRARRLNV